MSDENPKLRHKNWALLATLALFCITMYVVSFIRFGATVHSQ